MPQAALTPTGRLHLTVDDSPEQTSPWTKRLIRAFEAGPEAGLFFLVADSPDEALDPTLDYWRDLAGRYMTRLCHAPEASAGGPDFGELSRAAVLEPPGEPELAELVLCVPPMKGAEYVCFDVLGAVWRDLDGWVRRQVSAHGGVAAFLEARAPRWHRVGRVCFHLAENKRDPDYPFAFLATYSSGLSKGGRLQHLPLSRALQEYAGAKNKQAMLRLLSPVHRASQRSALAGEIVESGDIFHPLAWTPKQAYRFLRDVPVFEESGVTVRLPDWWRKRARPGVAVTIGNQRKSTLGTDAMLDFNVELALGDEVLTPEELDQLLQCEDGLVLLRGQWVEVDRAKLSEALEHWKQVEAHARNGEVSFIEGMRLLAGASSDLGGDPAEQEREWSFVRAGDWLREVLADLRDPGARDASKPGRALKTELRHYQQDGLNWLWLMVGLGMGACLADDMGLGKTIQVLALLLCRKQRCEKPAKPSLLVLPASLLSNWQAETERFAPSLKLRFVHPSMASREELDALVADPARGLSGCDLAVTTYAMTLRQEWLADVDWHLVILDEAQAIKNPSSRQTRTVKRFRADARIALTGTPVENRLGDLWSLFDFLNPGLLGSARTFKGFIRQLQDRERNRYGPLRKLVGPYILRRLKTDKHVISDLPDKTEVQAFCGLSQQQVVLYEKSVRQLQEELGSAGGMQRRGLVLAYLMRFKQICNHPSQWLGDGLYAPGESGKFRRLAEICEEIASRQEKALVFTQFREMTDPLAEFLARVFARNGLVLHGGTSVRKRKERIDAFQRETGPPFLVISLKAGGTGLNLTAASHVIHFDRWWNPAVENQATDRAFRIGQTRNVLVHKFVTRGTVEERIDELIQAKAQLAADVLEGGAVQSVTEMSDDELVRLVSLDVNKART